MISFKQVTKQYGSFPVLKDVTFDIGEGEVVGLLGPNGAGKTTTLRILTGVLPPTGGIVSINGGNPLEQEALRNQIGFLPENNPLYEELTVEEWLKFWSRIKGLRAVSQQKIIEAVELSGLEDVYFRFVGELSKGYRQRVGLAQAILSQPDILVLDEPTEGLDPNQRADIHKLIKSLGKKRTVIISSHILAEITKMCSRVMILNRGEIVADGTPEGLAAGSQNTQMVRAVLKGKGVLSELRKLKGITEVSENKGLKGQPSEYTILGGGKTDLRLTIFNAAKQKDWELYELSKSNVGLEEVFAELTKA